MAIVCDAKMLCTAGEQYNYVRLLADYEGSRIRIGFGIGNMKQGEPALTEIAAGCLKQLIDGSPKDAPVHLALFTQGTTGEMVRMRRKMIAVLSQAKKDGGIVFVIAKNSKMYDKVFGLFRVIV
jgi:hypothetical protein